MNGINEIPPEQSGGATSRRWSFGDVVLDEATLELTVTGQPVKLERKPLEVLIYLLNHANEVVTKDELAENLWPGRILSENVVARCISVLREALKADRTVIRTVHGYGYRMVAEVRVEASRTSIRSSLAFETGASPPRRPQWKLVERLGVGGHGEAWLARHEKTGEPRVFKFARDKKALDSLKREITLYRLMRNSLGEAAPIARLLEWNLEELPYFIEAEFVDSRDLHSWADAIGGLRTLPLEERLEIVAKVADALAAAHSVGALHKDLKPANILVEPDQNSHHIKLCDFGSGGVLDLGRLEALGITSRCFTQASIADERTAATALYVAPEVIAGQPSTVKADIYALGVLLYQMVVCDLQKPLAPGWELDVGDELLQEDIAAGAAGNPAMRLADAGQLAERIRGLRSRRATRAADRVREKRAQRAREAYQALRRARFVLAAMMLLTAMAVGGGFIAYRAERNATAATANAQSISDFLMEDVLSADPVIERPRDASYESLLNRAAARVRFRFATQPEAAARVHWLLGRRFHELGQIDKAQAEYEAAAGLFSKLHGPRSGPALFALDRLMWIYADCGRIPEAVGISEQLRRYWESQFGTNNLSILMIRTRIARTLLCAGKYKKAEQELRLILGHVPTAEEPKGDTAALFQQWLHLPPQMKVSKRGLVSAYAKDILGASLLAEYAGEYRQAVPILRDALADFTTLLGDDSELSAETRLDLGHVLSMLGNYDEAEALIHDARTFFEGWLPKNHYLLAATNLIVLKHRIEQRRGIDGERLAKEILAFCDQVGKCTARIRAETEMDLGQSYAQLERWGDAIASIRKALATYENARGRSHVASLRFRVALADALRRGNRRPDAQRTLNEIPPTALSTLPARHQLIGDLARVQGLLWIDGGNYKEGIFALQKSLDITKERFGAQHWRTQRVRREIMEAQLVLH